MLPEATPRRIRSSARDGARRPEAARPGEQQAV
ncbi:hypothetical protein JOD52_002720 [Brachybacterium muris]|nr:hypothetical protein [Brachybacterium muris]